MKKTLKSILVVLLILTMLFLLTGCGNKENETENSDEQKQEFSLGEWKDDVYTNNFLGLKFNLPNGWTYYSKEEMADIMNLSEDVLNDEQKAVVEVSKLTTAYYMMSSDPNTGSSIAILSEKPAMDVTTEFYINQLKNQVLNVYSAKCEINGTSKEKVGNREYDTLTLTASVSGNEVMQRYYVYKMDKYFICILATKVMGETTIEEMMQSFE